MSTFRNPVGPQPSSTYWRRRLVVILGLVAVIVVIVLIAVRPGSSPASEQKDDKAPAAASDAATDAPADADPGAPCADGVVSVVGITDAGDYAAGQTPLLSLSITNTGTTPCTFPAGSDVQEYVITSGEERIWSSKDCQAAPVADVRVLEPGVALTTTPFPWDRTRSAPDACDAAKTAVTAGGASYHLGVTVNGVASADTRQFLLN
jgi:hypothetical protein